MMFIDFVQCPFEFVVLIIETLIHNYMCAYCYLVLSFVPHTTTWEQLELY
jgi:hypothetical protein